MKKATITDVAVQAGVSKATVSRYLKQENVKSEIAKKIEEAIQVTGYVHKSMPVEQNKKESSMETKENNMDKKDEAVKNKQPQRMQRNYIFALLTTDFTKARTRNMIRALEVILHEEGCLLQICDTHGDSQAEERYIVSLKKQRVNAIFVESCCDIERVKTLVKISLIPMFYLNNLSSDISNYMFDEVKAGKILAEYMMEKRHLIIRYIGVDQKLCDLRIKGIKDAYHAKKQPLDIVCKISNGTYTDSFEKIKEVFGDMIDLLILEHDEMAIPLTKFVKDYHIAIPQNTSVLSFGGHEIVNVISPTMACISYDYKSFAKWITECAFARLEGKQEKEMPNLIHLQSGESIR